ncbi:hypothetical protein [Bacillus atrophaeus]|uniref:hypothetical protein n=1 Tax=Bacillus atrophaeus TaxID=1452 RepID=UPI002DBA4172|nr:hypothetical protein [Bacillus atrophaeus]MEC2396011.1 hypothetical protein [Bacillus atrophaeus]
MSEHNSANSGEQPYGFPRKNVSFTVSVIYIPLFSFAGGVEETDYLLTKVSAGVLASTAKFAISDLFE